MWQKPESKDSELERPHMTRSFRLLVVDDDPSVSEWISIFGERLAYEVQLVHSGEEALEAFRRRRPDLVTLDVLLPGIDGVTTLKALKGLAPQVPVIMVSGHGQTPVIVEALRNGASDFLRKPFEPAELELAFRKALEKSQLEREVAFLRSQAPRPGEETRPLFLFSETPKMRAIEDVIDHVADTDITVLIRGESGTGKELVARTLYERSGRPHSPFIKVNCAALPSELLESELFGYEKGAFTGAQRRKLGKFEVANGGTIFLDEISELKPGIQAKLLQVLQDGQFSRLGGEGDVQVDTRIIAATNRNLEAAVRGGAFREDLFYRLNVVSVQIPPLRERREEIPLLVDHFLRRYARAYGKEYRSLSEALMGAFQRYHWPGNVRELENLVKRFVVLGSEQSLLQDLAARAAQVERRASKREESSELDLYLAGEVDRVNLKRIGREAARIAEKRLIEKVLHRTRWNRKEAAEILQISYKALLYKMKDAGLADSV
jgi:two-component system response regulator AtoC